MGCHGWQPRAMGCPRKSSVGALPWCLAFMATRPLLKPLPLHSHSPPNPETTPSWNSGLFTPWSTRDQISCLRKGLGLCTPLLTFTPPADFFSMHFRHGFFLFFLVCSLSFSSPLLPLIFSGSFSLLFSFWGYTNLHSSLSKRMGWLRSWKEGPDFGLRCGPRFGIEAVRPVIGVDEKGQ